MDYVRTVDFDAFPADRFDYQVLADTEAAVILAIGLPPGGEGPPRHVHTGDQLFYVLRGELTVELGEAEHRVPPDSMVFIPAGLPHRNTNRGSAHEVHLEMIVPPPHRGQPLFHPHPERVGTADQPGVVRALDTAAFAESANLKGFATQRLATRSNGSGHVQLYVAEVQPGASGPDWHIHRFEQLYFILAGELTVDVADQHVVAGAGSLVYLPAGVPHRNTNAGAVAERHIALLIPEPGPGEPFDLGVQFALSGKEF
jgi:quercetin dioxygenase-like cupin family protein